MMQDAHPESSISQPADPRPGAQLVGYLLVGVPDNHLVRMEHVAWNRPAAFIIPGTASFLAQTPELTTHYQRIQLGGKLHIPRSVPLRPCLNFMADADLYARSLRQARLLMDAFGTACFNHPTAVAATTRDQVAERLQGIAGLQVPRTIRVTAHRMAQLREAVQAAGLSYPVLARMAGDHNGQRTALIGHADDWEAANALPWGGQPMYLTQFVDFADAQGIYRKIRLAVVGERIVCKHCFISDHWMVHFKSRRADSQEEERAFIESFDARLLPRVAPAVLEVARRLKLDFFGMDACLRPDGSLLLFEANATMHILTTHEDVADIWVEPAARIRRELLALLMEPSRWRVQQPASLGPHPGLQ